MRAERVRGYTVGRETDILLQNVHDVLLVREGHPLPELLQHLGLEVQVDRSPRS